MSDDESDEAKRIAKKRKASRACDRCNSQHQPCDNAIPKCSVCERAGTSCTYNRPVRKRGPRTGYTGQHGERLWGLVIGANPELENVVLRILRDGTYGNTGIRNTEYLRNNDHQSELVNRFADSRLGRFLQSGDITELDSIPPAPPEPSLSAEGGPNSKGTDQALQMGLNSGIPNRLSALQSATSLGSASMPNPHGAPQNPGDLYTQSEDIRKLIFSPPDLGNVASPTPDSGRGPSWQSPASLHVTPPNSSLGANGWGNVYDDMLPRPSNNTQNLNTSNSSLSGASPRDSRSAPSLQETSQGLFDVRPTNQWYGAIPTDTLLNLGFVPGDGMVEDFLDLCDNPDPLERTLSSSADQGEDEEMVWRRLVMRGRFV